MNNHVLQFELWHDCNQKCKFCPYTVSNNKFFNKNEILDYIFTVLNDSKSIAGYNQIAFIGGEIFDGQLDNCYNKFLSIFILLSSFLKKNIINNVLIATSLIFNIDSLIQFLNDISEYISLDKIIICTSYDTYGRFHTAEQEKLWYDNMILLRKCYPLLKFHIETILTNDFILSVLNNKFDIRLFYNLFNIDRISYVQFTNVCFDKEYTINIIRKKYSRFLPERKSFLSFLKKTCLEEKTIYFNQLLNNNHIFETIIRCYDKMIIRQRVLQDSQQWYPGYADSLIPIINDIEQFKDFV